MKFWFPIIFIFYFSPSICAQNLNADYYIKTWKISDTSQTHQAEKIYELLKKNKKDTQALKLCINKLYEYINKHPNKRLEARILMFEVFSSREYRLKTPKSLIAKKVKEAIKLARKTYDMQLLAEIYSLAGQIDLEHGFLLYNLKALGLQRKIGFEHFYYVQNRYFNISWGLYKLSNFRQSINYGLECLKYRKIEVERWDPKVYIFQLDVIGASYKQIKMYDSAHYYYQQIIDTLIRKPDQLPKTQQLWLAIAKGNIGHILSLQNKDQEAFPLIKNHLQNSIKFGSWNNAAMAQNNLSRIYLKEKLYDKAIIGFQKAHHWARRSDKLKEKIIASKGLADAYRYTKLVDSAFYYYFLNKKYQDSLNISINKNKFSEMKAKIAFDNASEELLKANDIIDKQRLTRNFILAVVGLITLVLLLVYRERILKQKYENEELQRKQSEINDEMAKAKKQLSIFTQNIFEKERLILDLKGQLSSNSKNIPQHLSEYILVTDAEWERFRIEFSKAYPNFLSTLKKKLEYITPAEERLATLMYLQLTLNQIANMLGIAKASVGRSRRRLKQKLDLPQDVALENYLSAL